MDTADAFALILLIAIWITAFTLIFTSGRSPHIPDDPYTSDSEEEE